MKNEHSPAPWKYWSDGFGHFGWTDANGKPANTDADTKLRTAAPELLEVVRLAIEEFDAIHRHPRHTVACYELREGSDNSKYFWVCPPHCPTLSCICAKARTALAKATKTE